MVGSEERELLKGPASPFATGVDPTLYVDQMGIGRPYFSIKKDFAALHIGFLPIQKYVDDRAKSPG